jgi:hypothetical protein
MFYGVIHEGNLIKGIKNILKNKKKEEKSKTLYIDSGITIFGLNIEICIDEKVKDNLDKYKETIKSDIKIINKNKRKIYEECVYEYEYILEDSEINKKISTNDIKITDAFCWPEYNEYCFGVTLKDSKLNKEIEDPCIECEVEIKNNTIDVNVSTHWR